MIIMRIITPDHKQNKNKMSLDEAISCTRTASEDIAYSEMFGVWINQRD